MFIKNKKVYHFYTLYIRPLDCIYLCQHCKNDRKPKMNNGVSHQILWSYLTPLSLNTYIYVHILFIEGEQYFEDKNCFIIVLHKFSIIKHFFFFWKTTSMSRTAASKQKNWLICMMCLCVPRPKCIHTPFDSYLKLFFAWR